MFEMSRRAVVGVLKAHRLVYHSTLGLNVITEKNKNLVGLLEPLAVVDQRLVPGACVGSMYIYIYIYIYIYMLIRICIYIYIKV